MKNNNLQRIIYQTLKPINELLKEFKSTTPDSKSLNPKEISWVNEKHRIIWENL